MSRNTGWFRFYDRMIDSPQVLELNDTEFRLLVSMWCLASASEERGVVSYSPRALQRRVLPDHDVATICDMLTHLVTLHLITPSHDSKSVDSESAEAAGYTITDWDKHQYAHASWTPEARREQKRAERARASHGRRNDVASGRNVDTDTDTDTEIVNQRETREGGSALQPPPPTAPATPPTTDAADAADAAGGATAPAESPVKPLLKTFTLDDAPYQLAAQLRDAVLAHNPQATDAVKARQPNGLQAWARQMESVLRERRRAPPELAEIITYAVGDPFWQDHVLNPAKLKRHLDTIDSQRRNHARAASNGHNGSNGGNGHHANAAYAANGRRAGGYRALATADVSSPGNPFDPITQHDDWFGWEVHNGQSGGLGDRRGA